MAITLKAVLNFSVCGLVTPASPPSWVSKKGQDAQVHTLLAEDTDL